MKDKEKERLKRNEYIRNYIKTKGKEKKILQIKRYRQKNRIKYNEYHRKYYKKYYKNNKDKICERQKNARKKNKKAKRVNRKWEKERRLLLKDGYVKKTIYNIITKMNLKIEINQEMIEVKRRLLFIKRLIKSKKQQNQAQEVQIENK